VSTSNKNNLIQQLRTLRKYQMNIGGNGISML